MDSHTAKPRELFLELVAADMWIQKSGRSFFAGNSACFLGLKQTERRKQSIQLKRSKVSSCFW